jgi:aerobic carbon-monoxide dehydrogenase large subunit
MTGRFEDERLLTGRGTFLDGCCPPDALHVTFARSIHAHAAIRSIDVSRAAAVNGVVAVFTAATLGLDLVAPEYEALGVCAEMSRSLLASDRVRFVGEPLAAIVSTTPSAGADAVELVDVKYEVLAAVIGVDAALSGTTLLFPDAGTNVAYDIEGESTTDLFDDCEVVVTASLVNQRVAPCPMEVRTGAARWDETGRLTQWASTQSPHAARTQIAMVNGREDDEVRVITPDVGGGFGAKIGVGAEDLVLGRIATLTGHAVRYTETRTESMLTMGHGRGQSQRIEIGGHRDGTVVAYRLSIVGDCGAYPRMGAILPGITAMMAPGPYSIERVEVIARAVVTNTCPIVAYRGAGRPEATCAIERAIDLFAAEIGLDPVEVRRVNLIDAASFPFDSATGATYDSGDYHAALDALLVALDLPTLRAEQATRRASDDSLQIGVGVATYVEVTAPLVDGEWADIEINPDGGAVIRSGTMPQGQGHATTFATIAAEQLGIDPVRIRVEFGDTDIVATGGGTSGSRSVQVGGSAVRSAAIELVELARRRAADLFESAVEDVVFEVTGGRFHVAGAPSISHGWGDLASSGAGVAGDATTAARLGCATMFEPDGSTFPFGAHAAVVEVDVETGAVRLMRMVTVDDAGRIVNPMIAEGQIHGGLAQGIAQALQEEFIYDEDGNPKTANLAEYAFISTCELPSFETQLMETPTPLNELGAKGIGESGTIGSTPAVQSAVIDALAHLGVRHIDLPLTPERVWRAIRSGRYS